MGATSSNAGTWSVMGIEHPNGREWGYRYHFGPTNEVSPGYTTRALRDAVMAAASQSDAAWLAVLPAAVRTWVSGYDATIRDQWRAQDAAP